MTNTNSPTYAQITAIMRTEFEERDAPQWQAYLQDIDDCGYTDEKGRVEDRDFASFWLAVAANDYASAASTFWRDIDPAWLQDARHPSDVANLETAAALALAMVDGWARLDNLECLTVMECIVLLVRLDKASKAFLAGMKS